MNQVAARQSYTWNTLKTARVRRSGYYLHYPEGFKRTDVDPPAKGWCKTQRAAEAEATRLATATGKAFLVVVVMSKCVPWMPECHAG